ncbi:hypothetical protein RUM44_000791 [Polyplax serrata]|uniref:RNA exonuclease 4 n=1 Tax=Polyplax serrata TaxID=468196 RepID=A0ABR1B8P0_POLSC
MNRDTVTIISKGDVSANWLKFQHHEKSMSSPTKVNEKRQTKQLYLKSNEERRPDDLGNATKIIHRKQTNQFNFKNKKVVTKVLALDCEMVSDMNNVDMLARISVVNFRLECIYDKFVKPQSKVGDFRTRFSGIREDDLVNGADFEDVQREVKQMLKSKILVGHALHNDLRVLKFGHHKQLIRDTSRYEPFRQANGMKSPSLKKLAKEFLNEDIQEGEHDSVEDAKAAMKLYKKYRKDWEVSLQRTRHRNEDQKINK